MGRTTAILATIALGVMVAVSPATVSMARGGHGFGHHGFGGHGFGHRGFGGHGFGHRGFGGRGFGHRRFFGHRFGRFHHFGHRFGHRFGFRHHFRRFGRNDLFWGPFYSCEFPGPYGLYGLYGYAYPYDYCY